MKNRFLKTAALFIFAALPFFKTQAQIAGAFSVPGNFPTIAAAINTLNLLGVAGPVTINVAAGYTETATAGGYTLSSISGVSSTNSVSFVKSGAGANPVLNAPSTATTSGGGIWLLSGCDYVTIDGIDLLDPNTTAANTVYFGYGFVKASVTNGSQYNTIKNCNITLNRNNPNGCTGILLTTGSVTAINYTAYPTSGAGTNSYNKFYNNTIQNCNTGITLYGLASTNASLTDQFNDVGGASAATGNTFVNYGGGVGYPAEAVVTANQFSLNISYNTITNNNGSGFNHAGHLYGIWLQQAPRAMVTVKANTITLTGTAGVNSGSLIGIYNQAGDSHSAFVPSIHISNNVFPSFTYTTGTFSGAIPVCGLIHSNSGNGDIRIDSNYIGKVAVKTVTLYPIYLAQSYSSYVRSNTITAVSLAGNQSYLYTIYCNNAGVLTGAYIQNNLIENVTCSGVSLLMGIRNTNCYYTMTTNNTIRNFSFDSYSVVHGISDLTLSQKTVSGNSIYNISTSTVNTIGANITGIYLSNSSSMPLDVSSNSVYSFSSSAGDITGILFTSGSTSTRIWGNKISSFSGGSGSMIGISLSGSSANYSVSNNVIGKLGESPTACGYVSGLYSLSSGSVVAYYNTINLDAVSSNTTLSSDAIYYASTAPVTLRNNILVNTSAAAVSGGTATVFRRTAATSSLYVSTSNNNLFYVGLPAPNRLLYADGTNTFNALPNFKNFVTPREALSVTENPPFLTTVGSATNFLSIDPSVPTQVESGAQAITGFTTDYAGTVRSATAPDIGAWEGGFTQADVLPPVIASSGFTSGVCSTSGRTFTANLTDVSGVASGSSLPRLYYKVNFGLYTSVQGSLTSGSVNNGTWNFNMPYTANAGDVIYYFLALQDQSSFGNYTLVPSGGSTSTDINNVTIPPNPAYNFTVGSVSPTVVVNSGSVCAGQSFTLNPTGATSYTISGGSAIVNPTVNTSYSVIGSNSLGCTAVAVANITVAPLPTVSVGSGSVCSGQSFTLSPSGAASYSYSGGSAVVQPTLSASYSVTGTNSLGCVSNAAVSNVSVFSNPTITAASGSICAGSIFTITPLGAASYTISGGSATVSPAADASYSVVGTSSVGCAASNTAVVNVVVAPLPTISAPGGTLCSGRSFTIQPTGAGTYTISGGSMIVSPLADQSYTVTGTSTLGCRAINTVVATVSVFASPVISVSSGSICSGQSFTISPAGAASYSYSGGSAVVQPTLSASYSVTGTNSLGCLSNVAVSNVTVFAVPSITAASGSICAGGIFTINPSGAASYTISGGSVTVSPAANASYLVAGTSSAGCVGTSPAIVNVSVMPLPTISVSGGTLCSGQSFTFHPTGAGTYSYSGGSAVVNPSSNQNYSVTGTSTAGCAATNTAVATVSVFASPAISINSGSICSGSSFTLNPSGTGLSYAYSGGSAVVSPASTTSYSVTGTNSLGCVSNQAVATITVNTTPTVNVTSTLICIGNNYVISPGGAASYTISGGTYTVSPVSNASYSVSGTSTAGCVSAAAVVNVSVAPLPTISVNSGSICSGSSFTMIPSGASTYTISGGAPVVSPPATAVYSVAGTSSLGCASSNTALATVTVAASPSVSVNSGSVCSGHVFTMVPSGAFTYSFSNGSPTVSPSANSAYSVTGTSSLGCISNVAIASVTVNTTPTLAVNNGSICSGQVFTIVPTGADNYTLSPGAFTVSPLSNSSYTITGANTTGCVASNTVIASVTVYSLPVISVSGQTAVCQGALAVVNSSGALTYSWSNGSNGNATSYTPAVSSIITVTGTAVNGCTSTANFVITVNSLPIVSANASNTFICTGSAVTFSGSGATAYLWSGGINNNSTVYPTGSNTYTLHGTDANGCVGIATVQVIVNPLPNVQIAGYVPDTLCAGQTITLTASGANTYSWASSEITPQIVVTPSATTDYSVTGNDINGCKATAHITQLVGYCLGIASYEQDAGISIYPNPGNGAFTLLLNGHSHPLQMEVYNTMSQLIHSDILGSAASSIDLTRFAKGVYVVRLYDAGRLVHQQKLIIAE